MMKLIKLFIFVELALSHLVFAETNTFTLNDCIQLGLKNNKGYLMAKEQLVQAQADLSLARAGYFPLLEGTGNYTYIGIIPEVDQQTMGVAMPNPLNPYNHYHFLQTTTLALARRNNWSFGLRLVQPIFTWGRLCHTYKQAKLNVQIAEENLRQMENRLVFEIKQTFYSILLAQEIVTLSEESIKQMEEHVKVAQANYRTGLSSKYDLLSTKVQLENIKPKLTQSKNALLMTQLQLKNLIGMDIQQSINIKGSFEYKEEKEFILSELIDIALKNRPEIKIMEIQKEIGQVLKSMARVGNKPNLTFISEYKYKYMNNEQIAFESKEPNSWTAALNLSIPISEWFPWSRTIASTKKAESAEKEIQLTKEEVVNNIILEINQIYHTLQEVKERLTSQKENIAQAEEGLAIAQTRYKNGMMISLELLNAELALTQAKTNYIQALYDYIIAKISLERAVGIVEK